MSEKKSADSVLNKIDILSKRIAEMKANSKTLLLSLRKSRKDTKEVAKELQALKDTPEYAEYVAMKAAESRQSKNKVFEMVKFLSENGNEEMKKLLEEAKAVIVK